jgi:hypothetical protein
MAQERQKANERDESASNKKSDSWPSVDSQNKKKASTVCFIYFHCSGGETRGWQF